MDERMEGPASIGPLSKVGVQKMNIVGHDYILTVSIKESQVADWFIH